MSLVVEHNVARNSLQPVASAGDAAHSNRSRTASDEDRILVWDIAVRLFHWSLVTSVAGAWLSSDLGGKLHERIGYVVLGLIAFRVFWGVFGTRHARFIDFVPTPRRLIGYLRDMWRGKSRRYIGHNPAGAVMIVALMLLLSIICATGWMMLTRQFFGVSWVEELHAYAANALLLLIPLHVLGAFVSGYMHRENLIWAMVTGHKRAADAGDEHRGSDVSAKPGAIGGVSRASQVTEATSFCLSILAASFVAYMIFADQKPSEWLLPHVEQVPAQRQSRAEGSEISSEISRVTPSKPTSSGTIAFASLANQLLDYPADQHGQQIALLACEALKVDAANFDAVVALSRMFERRTVRFLQDRLARAGFYRGGRDGDLGPRTLRAMRQATRNPERLACE